MKTPDRPIAGDHPQALLLPYLEDRLSKEERLTTEAHLRACDACSTELRELESFILLLKIHKAALCPEPWQLYEFAETGNDPNGMLRNHLEQCSMCGEEVSGYRESIATATAPAQVKDVFQEHSTKASQSRPPKRWLEILAQSLKRLPETFRVPALAVGTVGVAILLLVVLYPRPSIEPFIGLSSVTWQAKDTALRGNRELIPKSGLFEEPKARVAMILVFKGFRQPVPQEKIDSLYEALKPTPEEEKRFSFLTPAQLKTAIAESDKKLDNRSDLLEKLRTQLDVSWALILELFPNGNQFRVHSEMINTEDGAIVGTRTDEAVSEVRLPRTLRENVLSMTNRE